MFNSNPGSECSKRLVELATGAFYNFLDYSNSWQLLMMECNVYDHCGASPQGQEEASLHNDELTEGDHACACFLGSNALCLPVLYSLQEDSDFKTKEKKKRKERRACLMAQFT